MKHLLVLGAGTAGTMAVNKLRGKLDPAAWQITIVDRDTDHHYQPGYLFIPFGTYVPSDVVKPRERFIPDGVELVLGEIDRVDPQAKRVLLEDGRTLPYDQLLIASGTSPRPDQTPGMAGSEWRKSVFDFYTLEGATALADALPSFRAGRMVVHITEMPIKCSVAPLEFAFLADAYFRGRGIRDAVELVYVTPLDGAFTRPVAASYLGGMLAERDIHVETDFAIERVDEAKRALVSYDEREVPFDLLVTVPVNTGADFIARSGLGDELNHVRVDKHTLLSKAHDDIFALGDAADLPTSKAGSTAHYSIDLFAENFLEHVRGRPMTRAYDGHTNCFVESGDGKGLLLDFNYDTQPLPGKFPLPVVGPFSLLEETEVNHAGKMMFKWMYWNLLLPGRDLPLPALMTMAGKSPSHLAAAPLEALP